MARMAWAKVGDHEATGLLLSQPGGAGASKGLTAERRQAAIKGWSVSTDRALRKGEEIGAAPPLLVHQTLANRKEVIVCANCHRFLGTEATQLAVLEGLRPATTTSTTTPARSSSSDGTKNTVILHNGRRKKRPRTRGISDDDDDDRRGGEEGGGAGPSASSLPSAARISRRTRHRSHRIAVADAHPSQLPGLPCLLLQPDSNGSEDNSRGEAGSEGRERRREREDGEGDVGGDGIYQCERGAPCDDLFCSPACRRAAMAAGHGLICVGSREKGSPIYEFRRYAERTSETYLIAAAGVAAALSLPEGTRPFEVLAGWDEPLSRLKGNGAGDLGEEAEEAWSMLSAALMCERQLRDDQHGNDSDDGEGNKRYGESLPNTTGAAELGGGCGGAEGERRHTSGSSSAMTLAFFLRIVRALEKHLAPMMVPSPLVSYCNRLSRASWRTKAQALPWLSDAIARVGPCAGAGADDEVDENGDAYSQKHQVDDEVLGNDAREQMLCERALCRLAQAASAGGGVASNGPFPPLSVVGLLPSRCCPEHSCIPNVQLEAFLLCSAEHGDCHDVDAAADAAIPTGNEGEGTNGSFDGTALRVGLLVLRGVRSGEELFASYVALAQHVGQRRHELSSRLSYECRCSRCRLELEGDQECGAEMTKILADQALEEGRHAAAFRLYNASLEEGKNALVTTASASLSSSQEISSASTSSSPLDDDNERNTTDIVRGDALHGVGVALLAAGEFQQACLAWERGLREAPTHPALIAQAEKAQAYRPKEDDIGDAGRHGFKGSISNPCESLSDDPGDDEVSTPKVSVMGADSSSTATTTTDRGNSEGKQGPRDAPSGIYLYDSFTSQPRRGREADVFMSRAPVLSQKECQDVIRVAGEYARANGGWTTSRHYAVPTTDLPLHVLEPLLPWFRSLLSSRLFPSLAEQFKLGCGGRGVFVHDAFVVRYQEGKQRHLPLHRDQSTHSFTIALNSLDDYTGGGTFFPALGRALRPAEGHVVSFRGSILHGGDPVLRGVRYIIACFCYADRGKGNASSLSTATVRTDDGNKVAGCVDEGGGAYQDGGYPETVSSVAGGGVGTVGGKKERQMASKIGIEFGGSGRGSQQFSFGFSL